MSENTHPDRLDMASTDLVQHNIEALAALFPNCVTETADGKAVDFDLLKQELNHQIIEGNKERYRLEWPGKREAIVTANLPTTKTLRPVREDSVDFDNTENLYIEGDNLEVLKLLQESYFGKIKMIYIDPPYNTGKDFIYKDNFTQDLENFREENGLIDENKKRLVVNSDTSGRYHSDWLSMMYARLKLARNLLTEDGLIFISIDENESHNLRKICEEIFGQNNYTGEIIWKNSSRNDQDYISMQHEYIVSFVKNKAINKGEWREKKEGLDDIYKAFERFKKIHGNNWEEIHKEALTWYNTFPESNPIYGNKHYSWTDEEGVYFASDISGPNNGQYVYDVINPRTQQKVKMPSRGWFCPEDKLRKLIDQDQVHFGSEPNTVPCLKTYLKNTEYRSLASVVFKDGRSASKLLKGLFGEELFTNPKNVSLLANLIKAVGVSKNDIVLDFFSGSATTAEAVCQLNLEDDLNCKYILVQIPEDLNESLKVATGGAKKIISSAIAYLKNINKPENICEIAKIRIKKAADKIKSDWSKKHSGKLNFSSSSNQSIDLGFRVYKVDESNMKDVYYHPQDYNQDQLEIFSDNIRVDRTADDLLTQIMLDWGLPLSYKIEQLSISEKQVFQIAHNSLMACFDEGIDETFAKEVAGYKPMRIVFRDKGFKNDTAKENVRQLLKQLCPETEMRVI